MLSSKEHSRQKEFLLGTGVTGLASSPAVFLEKMILEEVLLARSTSCQLALRWRARGF